MAGSLLAADVEIPWQRKIRRVGQLNMTEHDPVALDVELGEYRALEQRRGRESARALLDQRRQLVAVRVPAAAQISS